jgi:hypothetical protein
LEDAKGDGRWKKALQRFGAGDTNGGFFEVVSIVLDKAAVVPAFTGVLVVTRPFLSSYGSDGSGADVTVIRCGVRRKSQKHRNIEKIGWKRESEDQFNVIKAINPP